MSFNYCLKINLFFKIKTMNLFDKQYHFYSFTDNSNIVFVDEVILKLSFIR